MNKTENDRIANFVLQASLAIDVVLHRSMIHFPLIPLLVADTHARIYEKEGEIGLGKRRGRRGGGREDYVARFLLLSIPPSSIHSVSSYMINTLYAFCWG